MTVTHKSWRMRKLHVLAAVTFVTGIAAFIVFHTQSSRFTVDNRPISTIVQDEENTLKVITPDLPSTQNRKNQKSTSERFGNQREKHRVSASTRPSTHVRDNHINFPSHPTQAVSCEKLFHGNKNEVLAANNYQKSHAKVPVSAGIYVTHVQNCTKFRRERRYILNTMSEEEEQFPIAFSILVFKHVEQAERLLRAIYRPQNYYCIHVDAKAEEPVKAAMKGIANCFDNVFVTSKLINVQWGTYSVLEADLQCMRELIQYKRWRYFINLTGQEFPLRTNAELVKILQVYNGSNNMEGTLKRRNMDRFGYVFDGAARTYKKKEAPPHGIVPVKGSVHITASRKFVEYVFNTQTASDFLSWVKDVSVPDESFFSSLNHNPQLGVPGAYKGDPETDPDSYPFITRFKNWGDGPFNYPCSGQRVRMVCVFAVGDLPLLQSRRELFANKFYLDWEPLTLDCMEELYFNRTRAEFKGKLQFDVSFYKSLPFVKNHV